MFNNKNDLFVQQAVYSDHVNFVRIYSIQLDHNFTYHNKHITVRHLTFIYNMIYNEIIQIQSINHKLEIRNYLNLIINKQLHLCNNKKKISSGHDNR